VNNFEFDKIILAVALAIFVVVFSNAFGGFFYRTQAIVENKGYVIEVSDVSSGAGSAPKTLPDVLDIAAIFKSVDIENGKKVFSKCAVCHTNGKGEANKVGPNLYGIVGHAVASRDGVAYSPAMKAKSEQIKVWGLEELYRYLFSPKAYVPGTKMAFAGIKDDKDRADLIAYLNSLSDKSIKLP